MQRFVPGQKLRRLPGGSLNRALDLVEKEGRFGPPPGPGDRPPTVDTPVLIVPCKNTSGVALPERAIVGVDVSAFTAPDITPGSPDANDADAAILRGVPVEIKKPNATTHASKWGVTLGPIGTTAPHNVGHLVISGLVWARVNVTDAAHPCVTIETDDYTYLKSAASGMAIWDRKLAGTGKQWALVLLGGGGGGTGGGGETVGSIRLARVTVEISKRTSNLTENWGAGSIHLLNDTTGEEITEETYDAFNPYPFVFVADATVEVQKKLIKTGEVLGVDVLEEEWVVRNGTCTECTDWEATA